MDTRNVQEASLNALRKAIEAYCPISNETWERFSQICDLIQLKKGQLFIRAGQTPRAIGFVYSGLLRAFTTDLNGNEYNNNFFSESSFPAAIVALLTASPSTFSIEALEESCLIQINFRAYRHLLNTCDDLKWFQILYLEKNWVIEKNKREVALVQEDATERYLYFRENFGPLESRIPQYHIASHLGITPTHLSRIRKALNNSQKA